jgi:Cu(I)/Ag(I) efflux system membrane fusion protein
MKISYKNPVLVAVISLIIGFSGAWLIWGNNSTEGKNTEAAHNHVAEKKAEEIWTCSMHPQIRQPEFGDCPICGMDLILLEENSSSDPLVLEMTEEAVKLSDIQTIKIGESIQSGSKKIRLSGKVQDDERLASSLVTHLPGRIEKLYVNFTGKSVQAGQLIAEIYSPDMISAQTELLEALKVRETNPALLDAARNKMRYWKIGDKLIEEIESSGKVMESLPIYAGSSGIVTKKKVSVGDYIRKGEVLFDLMDLSRVWVLFDVYEEDLASVSIGDQIRFTTTSMPGKNFSGKVSFIDPIINPVSRTVSVRTELMNSGQVLKPEMLVYGTIQKHTSGNSKLTVPKSAVLWTGKRSVVYVKIQDSKIPSFKFREIELGEALGDSYRIAKGLEAGEEVVTNGNFTIDAAAQLNNQASMMNKRVNDDGTKGEEKLADYSETTPKVFKRQLFEVAKAYLSVKDAFVATDAASAAAASEKMLVKLGKVDMSLLSGDAHFLWMDAYNAMEAHGKKLTILKDVEEQRKQFDFLSQALIRAIKVYGLSEDTLFVQHCPMAIGKHGADWISDVTAIRNPYFGDQMLKCGNVTDTLVLVK